jgi:hypothetical protein
MWRAVRAIREHHGDVFNLLPENIVAVTIIDVLAEMDKTPSLAELAQARRDFAQKQGPWTGSTPLAFINLGPAVYQARRQPPAVASRPRRHWLGWPLRKRTTGSCSGSGRPAPALDHLRARPPLDTHRGATILSL